MNIFNNFYTGFLLGSLFSFIILVAYATIYGKKICEKYNIDLNSIDKDVKKYKENKKINDEKIQKIFSERLKPRVDNLTDEEKEYIESLEDDISYIESMKVTNEFEEVTQFILANMYKLKKYTDMTAKEREEKYKNQEDYELSLTYDSLDFLKYITEPDEVMLNRIQNTDLLSISYIINSTSPLEFEFDVIKFLRLYVAANYQNNFLLCNLYEFDYTLRNNFLILVNQYIAKNNLYDEELLSNMIIYDALPPGYDYASDLRDNTKMLLKSLPKSIQKYKDLFEQRSEHYILILNTVMKPNTKLYEEINKKKLKKELDGSNDSHIVDVSNLMKK